MRIALVGLLWGATACVLPSSPHSATDEPPPPGMGQINVVWSSESESGSRSLLGSSWASSVADAYELLLVNADRTLSYDLSTATSHTVAVLPGSYGAFLLAGVKRSSGSVTAELIGSALAEGVVVVEGQRTPLALTLRSIDLSLSFSTALIWQSGVTALASGATRNARLGMQLSGTSTTQRPRFKSVELWNGYRESSVVTGTPDSWASQATAIVPDGISTVTVGVIGAELCFQNATDAWTPTKDITHFTWTWPNHADLTDAHPLFTRTQVTDAVSAPPTGADLMISWE